MHLITTKSGTRIVHSDKHLDTKAAMEQAGIRDLSGGYQFSSYSSDSKQYKMYDKMKGSHGSDAIASKIRKIKK